jgi:hypothetical protein
MGSKTYEFLAESLLFDQSLIEEKFSSVTEQELEQELERYRVFGRKEAPAVEAEISKESSSLVVLADEPLDMVRLTQSALYVNQYVFDDPLLKIAERPHASADAMNQYLGMAQNQTINRRSLAKTSALMKSMTPFVAGNFLKFMPMTAERTDGSLPFNYSPTAYEDALPTEVLKLFKDAAIVKSLRKVDRGFVVENSLYPGRAIDISFNGHPSDRDFMYMLWEQEVIDMDEETRICRFALTIPDEAPNPAYFAHWVKQSVNQAALALFMGVENRLRMAASLNAVVGSPSELMFQAIQKAFNPKSSVPVQTANAFVNLDLPILAGITPEQVMRLRQDEGEAFKRFRLLLDQKLSGLRETGDPAETERLAALAVHELTEVRMDEIDGKMKTVKEKLAGNTILASLGLAAAIQTAGVGLLSTALAVANIGRTLIDYRQDVKRNPAFFLWKLAQNKK